VFSNQAADAVQFSGREAFVETEHDRLQPELADHSLTSNMHVLRLIAVEAVEKQPVWARNISNRWHYAFLTQTGASGLRPDYKPGGYRLSMQKREW